jgi:hypothetical protein
MEALEIAAIVNVVNLYPVAVDTQMWALFDHVFTENVHVDFGWPAVWDELGTLKLAFDAIHAPFAATQHATRGHHVVVDGDRATCLSYVLGRFIREVPGGGNMFESAGWYDDALVRTPAGWRIGRRTCRMLWWGGNPAVLQTSPAVPVEPMLDSLVAEARAARLDHLRSLERQMGRAAPMPRE